MSDAATSSNRAPAFALGGVVIGIAIGWFLFSQPPADTQPAVVSALSELVEPGDLHIQGGISNRLNDLLAGVPEPGGKPIAEVRSRFTPDETVLLQGLWSAGSKSAPLHFSWYAPTGEVIYESDLTVKPEWTNTWVSYRGPKPMKAGTWVVRITEQGKPLADLTFAVVREGSAIPVRAQARAFEAAKLDTPQATAIGAALRAYVAGTGSLDDAVKAVPPALAGKNIQIAVGAWADGKNAAFRLGEGKTLSASLKDAAAHVKKANLPADGVTLELSLLHSGLSIPASPNQVGSRLKGNTGFSLQVGDASATLLPPYLYRASLESGEEILRQLATDAGLDENGWDDKRARVMAFRTQDFVLPPDAGDALEMVASRVVVRPEELTYDKLLQTVDRTAAWYRTNQKEDGRLMYTFYPDRDLEPPDDWSLRVLNALFVVAEIAVNRPDQPELLEVVDRTLDAYLPSLVERDGGKFLHWQTPRIDSGLGSTAFILSTLATLNRPEDRELMEALSTAIIAEQAPDGRFSTDFLNADRDIDQQFYPGEGMLSLMRYHRATGNKAAKDAVANAFDWYKGFWQREKHGPYVPWQIRAYSELYQVDPQPKYRDYVFDLMDWMLKEMPPEPMSVGLHLAGSLHRMPASTGVYTEGLEAAWHLARETGDAEREARYGKALAGALRYVAALQFKEHDVYAYPRPEKIYGALATKPTNNELRLDFTYHGISAMNAATTHLTPAQWEALHASAFGE